MEKGGSVRDNIDKVQERIARVAERAGRRVTEIRLMAVTKTVDDCRIREAIEAGVEILGENYVQEAKRKIDLMGRAADWHLIGHLQTNKAKYAARLFDMIHSIDRIEVAQELDRRCLQLGRVMKVLVEVNVSGEATKRGIAPEGVLPLVQSLAALNNLSVQGLMTMAPWSDDPEAARPYFAALRNLQKRIQEAQIPRIEMKELSMGMSGDYEVAVEEGATIVRIGRLLFGERLHGSCNR